MLKLLIIVGLCLVGIWLFLAWWKFFFGFACGAALVFLLDAIFDFNSTSDRAKAL